MTFGEKIKMAREQKGMTQKVLARKIGRGENTIRHYEKETTEPNITVLCDVAKELGVSLSYLAGWTDKPDLVINEQPGTMGKRIRRARMMKGLRGEDLAYQAGISETNVYAVENGISHPSLLVATCISKVLGMTLEQLVGWEAMN